MNIAVATVTAQSAAKRITLSRNLKYDGEFTAIFRRKPKKWKKLRLISETSVEMPQLYHNDMIR